MSLNVGDDITPGSSRYPGDGREDDPPRWWADGALLRRDDDVVALCVDRPLAVVLVAILRRLAGDHDHDNPGPGIGGE